ncbi:MAG: hypothetical protein IKJ78_01755 [Bacteroidales bacterium]|nr:hypothetical protein [Bacteroidales bacterium]
MENSEQNQHEEITSFYNGKRKEYSKKKWRILIPISLLIIFIISAFAFFQYKQHKLETALIEEMTKELLAQYKCNGYIYQEGGNMIQQILQSGQITSNGYVGAGMDPSEIKDYVEGQLYALNYKLQYTTDFPNVLSQKPVINLEDEFQKHYESERKNTNVVLSKLVPVETTGKTKIWTYTEMNSGVDFIATRDEKGTIAVKVTEDGAAMCYNLYIKQHAETLEALYTEYKNTVSSIAAKERAERDRRDRNARDALFGLGLMGLFL